MTKIDVTPIEEMHRHLCAEIATLREVNAAQAEQLRKAQERIRAAEAENGILKTEKHAEAEYIGHLIAERDRAWNEAIEAAEAAALHDVIAPGSIWSTAAFRKAIARNIRSLAKQEAGE